MKGHECLQKLQGAKGSEVDEDVYGRLGDSTSDAGPSVETVHTISSSPQKDALPKRNLRVHRNIRHALKFTAEEDTFLSSSSSARRAFLAAHATHSIGCFRSQSAPLFFGAGRLLNV